MKFIIHTDGGARGNPGPAAVGVVIADDRHEVAAFGKRIGETTNNVAEYTAVIEALKSIKYQVSSIKGEERKNLHIQFYLDSTLVVNQINGMFKVKDAKLRLLLLTIRELEQVVGAKISYMSVPREQNSRADYFVNLALDSK